MANATVLFLCTGNSARSQMAEALLKYYAGDHFQVFSAGIEPKGINPYTIKVMNEMGIDIRGQRSKSLEVYLGQPFRYVVTVCGHADATCPQVLWAHGGEKLHWPFDDPAAETGTDADILAKFRAVRDQIDVKVQNWLTEQAINYTP